MRGCSSPSIVLTIRQPRSTVWRIRVFPQKPRFIGPDSQSFVLTSLPPVVRLLSTSNHHRSPNTLISTICFSTTRATTTSSTTIVFSLPTFLSDSDTITNHESGALDCITLAQFLVAISIRLLVSAQPGVYHTIILSIIAPSLVPLFRFSLLFRTALLSFSFHDFSERTIFRY